MTLLINPNFVMLSNIFGFPGQIGQDRFHLMNMIKNGQKIMQSNCYLGYYKQYTNEDMKISTGPRASLSSRKNK